MGWPDQPGEGRLPDPDPKHCTDRQRGASDLGPPISGTVRGPDRRAQRGRALPELTEGTAVRLVSYFGPDDAGSGIVVGDRVIPLVEYAGFDVDPDSLDDLRRRAAALTGAEGLAIEDLELVTPVMAPG